MRVHRALLPLLIVGASCVIPDTDIQVYSTQGCGEQWVASTPNAVGYNDVGKDSDIKTLDDQWIVRHWCLSPEQSFYLQFDNSSLYFDILADVIATCRDRALELGLHADNCAAVAGLAHSGECAGENEWCDLEESDDEVGLAPDMMR